MQRFQRIILYPSRLSEMIHGYKRNKRIKTEQEVNEEQELIFKINAKLTEFFAIPRANVSPQQLNKYLQFVALLMQLVSDIPTVFNFRRQLLQQSASDKSADQIIKMLSGEIKLTTKLIQADPKSYTIWCYRQWLVKWLHNLNSSVVKAQKELVKGLLMKDQKNFHVWNYRNWLNSIQYSIDDQIQFTEDKIKSNPFNFSPYHFRTKLLHQKYDSLLTTQLTAEERSDIYLFGMPKKDFQLQLERVKTAIFLNPNEEAPWLFYNWLLAQLVPAFVVSRTPKTQKVQEVTTNMKVTTFKDLIEDQDVVLTGTTGGKECDAWELKGNLKGSKISSNLKRNCSIKLQSTGRLFLGEDYSKQWVENNIKSIFRSQLAFIDEVIESEEEKCRFAYLQKSALNRLLLQCGTSEDQFKIIVGAGLSALKAIKNEPKGNKYICKQIEYWERLEGGQLSKIQLALKMMCS